MNLYSPIDGLVSIIDTYSDSFYIVPEARTIKITIGNLQSPDKWKKLLLVLGNCKNEYFRTHKIRTISMVMLNRLGRKLVVSGVDQERVLQILTNYAILNKSTNAQQQETQQTQALDRIIVLFKQIFTFYSDTSEFDQHDISSLLQGEIASIVFIFLISNFTDDVRQKLELAYRRTIRDIPLPMTLENVLNFDSLVYENSEDMENYENYNASVEEALELNARDNIASLNESDFNTYDDDEAQFFRALYNHRTNNNFDDTGPGRGVSNRTKNQLKATRKRKFYTETFVNAKDLFERAKKFRDDTTN